MIVATAGADAQLRRGMRWYVELGDGSALSRQRADVAFNPASVMKVATSWWAFERLGPNYRFNTEFSATAAIEDGVLKGDLYVIASGDPDFHLENAQSVARRLLEAGIREVRGDLVVVGRFTMGWEQGSEGRIRDPAARARKMNGRLLRALDPSRMTRRERQTYAGLITRRPELGEQALGPRIHGRTRTLSDAPEARRLIVRHRSNPLQEILKRFNSYSNNDIERFGELLGGPSALERFLRHRLEIDIEVGTVSGLGRNRMSARQAVKILRGFERSLGEHSLRLADVLPSPGCDPGSVERALSSWQDPPSAGAATVKTGTLIETDGGVVSLSGRLQTAKGAVYFAIAKPVSGRNTSLYRREIDAWLRDLADALGGARSQGCGNPVIYPDDQILLAP